MWVFHPLRRVATEIRAPHPWRVERVIIDDPDTASLSTHPRIPFPASVTVGDVAWSVLYALDEYATHFVALALGLVSMRCDARDLRNLSSSRCEKHFAGVRRQS
jgi:hypothetical protein